jgi:hypothetical protein
MTSGTAVPTPAACATRYSKRRSGELWRSGWKKKDN